MKRKLISFAIAFALLSQTIAFAGTLTTVVTGVFGGPSTRPDVSTKVTCSVDSDKTKSFDYTIGIDMSKVRDAFNSLYAEGLADSGALSADFNNSAVTGRFVITLDYESGINLTDTTKVLLTELNSQLPATSIFEVTNVSSNATQTVITVDVKGAATGDPALKVSTLNSNVNTYLADMAFTVGLTATYEKSNITASFVGTVEIVESDEPATNPFFRIGFNGNDATSVLNVTVYNPGIGGGSGGSSSGGGSGSGSWSGGTTGGTSGGTTDADTTDVSSYFESEDGEPLTATLDNNTGVIDVTGGSGSKSTTLQPPAKEGFIPNGYSNTPYAGGDKNYDGTSTGSGSRFYPRYVNVTVPAALAQDTDENGNPLHKSYIAGYPDGEVKPNNYITREEVTAAFDRLLNSAYRATIETTSQDFPDVDADRWSNDSIATMANGGFVVGDESGNFNPSKPITRAEFAVIASKFAPSDAELPENYFTDIDGHWAKDFILKIAGQYWISGYTDASFNPDGYITRAEAMAIINRMLVRYGDGDSEIGKEWSDVYKSDWYYDIVKEATNNNVFERTENGWSEKWVEE